jgi:hypothetical protein
MLLIYEKPDDFARRDSSVESEAYAGAWRAYHRALLDAGIFVGGKPLDAPETATTVRLRDSKREIQDGPYSNTKEQLVGSRCSSCLRSMPHWNGRQDVRPLPTGPWKCGQ